MYLLEKISNKIAQQVTTELKYDNDKEEVIAYGMHAILQIFFSIFFVVIFGLILDVLIEALIISFSTSILRKYSGGVHASTPTICMVVGTVASIGFGLLAKIYLITNLSFVLISSILVFIFSLIFLIKLAPVESKSKPISDKKKNRMKRGSLVTLSLYFTISVILLILYYLSVNIDLLRYIFCISIGTLWQVFTLTKVGDFILSGLDSFLILFGKNLRKGGTS